MRSMRETTDFYELFEEKASEFAASDDYAEFCKLAGVEYLAGYRWAPRVFDTAKAGKRTWRPLIFPFMSGISELFAEAKLLPSPIANKRTEIPRGFLHLSGGVCGTMGGQRGWSKEHKDIRSHFGGTFYGTYVRPQECVDQVPMDLVDKPKGYELISREDGVLVLANDGLCIGSEWLALLPKTESIETLFDADTKRFLESEREAERLAWGESEVEL